MKSTQKPEARAQTSRFTRNMRSKPVSQNDGLSRVQPPYLMPHHPDPPPAGIRTIVDWIRDLPEEFSDVDGGIVRDLMRLALCYLEQLKLPAMKHRGAASVLEEHRHKICLLKDDDNLDPRLAEAPKMRELFVSNLLSLVLLLSTGVNLVTAENRQSLLDDTWQIVEQASAIAFVRLRESAHYLPNSIVEFLDATQIEIKSRIDNVSDLMPATHHPVPGFDKRMSSQVEEIGPDVPRLSGSDRFFRMISKRLGSRNGGRARSDPSKSSSKHSSRSTNSHSMLSKFLYDRSRSRVRPSTITATSTSPSETRGSYSEVVSSASTRPSTNCKNCNAFLNEDAYESRVLGRQFKQIEKISPVKIKHPESKLFSEKTMLIDTGCDYNLITQSLVEELGIDTLRLTTPICYKGYNNTVFEVDQAVIPEWRFSEGSIMHQEFHFHIVPNIPGSIDIVVGNKAINDMNIHLCKVDGALVAMQDPEDVPTQEQSKLQRRRRDYDDIETKNNEGHAIKANFAEVVQQKKAAAKASNPSKSQNTNSERDLGGSCGAQR